MADEQTPPNRQETQELEVPTRLDAIERRVADTEKEMRLRSIEERLAHVEEPDDESDEDDNSISEGEGEREFRLAVAGLLKNETLVNGAAELMKSAAEIVTGWPANKAKAVEGEVKIALHSYYGGMAFGAVVLSAVIALIWHDKIGKDVGAGLLGSLIGYWYGRDKPKS